MILYQNTHASKSIYLLYAMYPTINPRDNSDPCGLLKYIYTYLFVDVIERGEKDPQSLPVIDEEYVLTFVDVVYRNDDSKITYIK